MFSRSARRVLVGTSARARSLPRRDGLSAGCSGDDAFDDNVDGKAEALVTVAGDYGDSVMGPQPSTRQAGVTAWTPRDFARSAMWRTGPGSPVTRASRRWRCLVELEDAGESLEDLDRRIVITTLLQPEVVVGADPGEHGYLFAAQPVHSSHMGIPTLAGWTSSRRARRKSPSRLSVIIECTLTAPIVCRLALPPPGSSGHWL
jgi:hypothetical protein